MYDQFSAFDWPNMATAFGKATVIINTLIGIVTLFYHSSKQSIYIALYTIIISLAVGIWEFPFIYSCVSSVDDIRDIVLERLYLKVPAVRAGLYVLLSIVCFLYQSLCLVAGLVFIFHALLLIFASFSSSGVNDDASLFSEVSPITVSIQTEEWDYSILYMSHVCTQLSYLS